MRGGGYLFVHFKLKIKSFSRENYGVTPLNMMSELHVWSAKLSRYDDFTVGCQPIRNHDFLNKY